MPKEIIRNRPEIDDGSLPWLHIGWGKEAEFVELGTFGPTSDYKLFAGHGDEQMTEVEPGGHGAGLAVQLDRAGINRIIRTLRKARDEAFGRDE